MKIGERAVRNSSGAVPLCYPDTPAAGRVGSDTSERGQVVLAHPNLLHHCSGAGVSQHSLVQQPPTPGVTPAARLVLAMDRCNHGGSKPSTSFPDDPFILSRTDAATIAEQLLPFQVWDKFLRD